MATVKMIAVPEDEYCELKRKADAYDRMNAGSSKGGKKAWANLSPEERTAWTKKYEQKN